MSEDPPTVRPRQLAPKMGRSLVTRPWVVTAEGDIPQGTRVLVRVSGAMPGGAPWAETLVNPRRACLPTPPDPRAFSFDFYLQRTIVASPRLEALVFEGDGRRMEFSAEALAQSATGDEPWMLVSEAGVREHIALRPEPWETRVESGDTERPWTLTVHAREPGGSELEFEWIGIEANGEQWAQRLRPGTTELQTSTIVGFRVGLNMRASPDGHQSPQFCGITLEGDRRKVFSTAADLIGAGAEGQFEVIRLSAAESVIMLKFLPPKFSQPPSALTRLMQLHQEGFFGPPSRSDDV